MHLRMDHPLAGFDWSKARAFLATVEASSLLKAARQLRLTQPTLSRQVKGPEADLGVVRFERVWRALVLTDAGRNLVDQSGDTGTAAGRIALALAGRSQVTGGWVTVSAGDAFALFLLTPRLAELQAIAPGIEIEVLAAKTVSDRHRRGADTLIRHLRPSELELIGRTVGEGRARLSATRANHCRRGRPEVASGLAGHDLLGFAPVERLGAMLVSHGLPDRRRDLRPVTHRGLVSAEIGPRELGMSVSPSVFARRIGGHRAGLVGPARHPGAAVADRTARRCRPASASFSISWPRRRSGLTQVPQSRSWTAVFAVVERRPPFSCRGGRKTPPFGVAYLKSFLYVIMNQGGPACSARRFFCLPQVLSPLDRPFGPSR
jgi:DNA-binding transcriptional LysR family regulator